jgi:hypothetical protein
MYDRACWTGKAAEANIFREWLVSNLHEAVPGEAEGVGALDDDETLPSLD